MNGAETANTFVTKQAWQTLLVDGGEILEEGMGGVAWMRCQVVKEKCQEVGDHVLVAAKVTEGGEYVGAAGDEGLVYWKGKYRKIGATIDV